MGPRLSGCPHVLPLNSFYSVAFAARDLLRSDPGATVYGDATDADLLTAMRKASGAPDSAFVTSDLPFLVRRTPVHTGTPRNLVIVLEESLGAQFVGNLGGKPLTPNLDRLSQQGWTLERLYATGTRSVLAVTVNSGGASGGKIGTRGAPASSASAMRGPRSASASAM